MLLLLAGMAAAEGRMGFLLQLYDPAGYVTGALQVNLKGSDGTTRRLDASDDGNAPDIQANDHIYTAPVPSFTDSSVVVDITSGSHTWHAEVTIPDDEKALVRLRLDPNGTAMSTGDVAAPRTILTPSTGGGYGAPTSGGQMGQGMGAQGMSGPMMGGQGMGGQGLSGQMMGGQSGTTQGMGGQGMSGQMMGGQGMSGQMGGQGMSGQMMGGQGMSGQMMGMGNGQSMGANTMSRQMMPGTPTMGMSTSTRSATSSDDLVDGLLVWGGGFVSFGAALGIVVALHGRRPGPTARLGADPVAVQVPRRLDAADVDAALAGPLRPYRVVVLGDTLPGTIPCDEAAPLPDEIVNAIERLATTAGGPPALLVTDPARIDRPHSGDPVLALAARIGGYFPLWVVGGPAAWPRWSPRDTTPAAADPQDTLPPAASPPAPAPPEGPAPDGADVDPADPRAAAEA